MFHPSRAARPLVFVFALCLAAFGSFVAPPAHADTGDLGTMFQVNDADPLANIPSDEERNDHPVEFGYYFQDLIARAQRSYDKQDWAGAVKYFEVVAHIVPNQAITFSRLCTAYAGLGRMDVAAANCARAVQLPGALVADHVRFISYSLNKEKFTTADAADVDASLAYLRSHVAALAPQAAPSASAAVMAPASGQGSEAAQRALAHVAEPEARAKPPANFPLQVETLACRLAVRLEDVKRLAACVEALKRTGADPRLVLSFDWSRALVSGDRKGADAILEQAEALKMPQSALKAMQAEQAHYFKPTGLVGFLTRGGSGRVTAIVVSFACVACALVWLLSGARRRKMPTETQVG